MEPESRLFAQELLAEKINAIRFKDEDRRLMTELTYGMIRRHKTLDAVLGAYTSQPVAGLESDVRLALELGLYQTLFLERIPPHAAVNEAVRLIRETGKDRSAGFVNAVLRAILRDLTFYTEVDMSRPRESFEVRPGRACAFGRAVLPAPARIAEWLSASHSFPTWLLGRWLAHHGTSRARELCDIANTPAPLFVRPNLLRTTPEKLVKTLLDEGLKAVPSPSGRTLRLPPHTHVAALRSLARGLFMVQDDTSATVAIFLGPKPGECVLDLCAAPGGKTCHIAELMGGKGRVIAVDSSQWRLEQFTENVKRLGHKCITQIEADGADFAIQHRGEFDRVLLDAPCSNTGVLRRRVEARWRLSERTLARLVKQQRALLMAGLLSAKPGGVIVYSTCSLEPEENGELVAGALRDTRGFRLDEEKQVYPERDGGDGLYMARIIRDAKP